MVSDKAVDTTQRLAALRKLMREQHLDAYVIPTDDAHSSEYVAPVDFRRSFISGFTGSAGTAIVTEKEARLFTDGRYFLQAGQQLDANWELMKRGEKDVPTWQEFLSEKLPDKTRIGVDATTIGISDAQDIKKALEPKKSELVSTSDNLVDHVWADERPSRPSNSIELHPEKYAGRSAQDKIDQLRKDIKEKKASAFAVSALDDIAWLFNLRGTDIDYNPVFFAFALVSEDKVSIYLQQPALRKEAKSYLEKLQVQIKSYSSFYTDLQSYVATLSEPSKSKILISEVASLAIADAIGEGKHDVVTSLVGLAKSIKNEVEIEGFRQCHIRDGAALIAYFAWLEDALVNKKRKLSEAEAADKLEELRSQLDLFKGLSFTTISSTGPNGAIIHYSPDRETCATIDPDQMYLCDSGGQYFDGTTDVTRTLHFGKPSDEERDAFTRVLQGHIALDRAVFPTGTTGFSLDPLARMELWRDGLDYKHGTGHGVGSFLNVHEGPHSISFRPTSNKWPLKAGMTVSNEPGYYKDGHWGIRIENVILVKEAKLPNNYGDKGYLNFERLTMTPIQTKLVKKELLSPVEVQWLNSYHDEVLEKVSPHLEGNKSALAWLQRECKHI